jgi:superfamily II DNA or RNA helicase
MKSELQDGIYEQVISIGLDKELSKALQEGSIWVDRDESVDSQEAVHYLSDYLRELIYICLKEIADADKDKSNLEDEVTLTNEVIQLLSEKITELGKDNSVVPDQFILKSVEHRKNKVKKKDWVRPDTSLSRSFLFTNSHNDASMVSELRKEIASSDRIDFLVSFIKYSGLTMILPYLRNFTSLGGKLRVITTTYMGATDPKAVHVLTGLPNTEVHISYQVKETRLHAKAYMFYRKTGFSTAYVGSSNLSHAAIADGLEWNMKITEQDMPLILDKMKATFETYWHSQDFVPYALEDRDKLQKAIDKERGRDEQTNQTEYMFDIHPYPYQQIILDALEAERKERNSWRNLVVAATGTGKTAISAFDYRNFARSRKGETKLLFIAHRKEILKQSLSCFRQVMKDPNFGELAVDNYHPSRLEHLFLSIQTCNSRDFCKHMDPHYYDMIIVDEFHHAAAKSYQNLLSHFKPKILLGLTATPERMDGKDILSYFDHRIAAEIRLSDAIERRLLCPFHYFGVADAIDLSHVKWTNGHYDTDELTNLYVMESTADKRAGAICEAVDRYTSDIRDVKGLGFCVSKSHAHFMAQYFNHMNIPSVALDSDSPAELRNSAKEQLESGKIRFIFVVDLFNEGVDIPSVNTVLFLRPTNSLTVFIQQLGRGLRLAEGKDCLTVLDFVAQANRKYNFSSRYQALLGKHHVHIQREIENDFPHAPKGCSIQLEKMAKEYVLHNIQAQIRGASYYKELLLELYESMGKQVPTLSEFLKAASIEPSEFYNGRRTYYRLCMDAGIVKNVPRSDLEDVMEKAFPKICQIDSARWIRFMEAALKQVPQTWSVLDKQYLRMWQYTVWHAGYSEAGMEKPEDALTCFSDMPGLRQEILDLLTIQYDSFGVVPGSAHLPYPCALEVYCNYSRDQIFAALGLEKPTSIKEGVKFLHQKNSRVVTKDTDVFLVTLNKSEKEFSDTTLYEDYSIDKNLFHWQSQSTTRPETKTGQRYIHQRENGNIVLLFVREAKKDDYRRSMNYTFLGQAKIVSWEGSRPMTIIYKMDSPIPAKYLVKTDTSGVL